MKAILSAAFLLVGVSGAQAATEPVGVELDSLEFVAPTNLKALTVKGKAKTLTGKAWFEAAKLTKVEATVPVDSLDTGMSMRDHHMKERIFTAADGKAPDLVFKSKSVKCEPSGACDVVGDLSIRGVPAETTLKCATTAATADCSTKILLSKWKIPQPTQLGVTVQDEVAVTLKVKKAAGSK